MKNVTLNELDFSNEYIANDGLVITNYKEGDSQIVFSKKLIFKKGSTPEGFYTMREADAQEIYDKFEAARKAEEEAREAEETERRAKFEHVEEPTESAE